jgi:hypothetical protein
MIPWPPIVPLLLVARLVAAPLPWVRMVCDAAERAGISPSLAVALVAVESRFRPDALGDDGTSWGLFQLCSRWHPWFRESLAEHCVYGTRYMQWCIAQEKGSWAAGIARYNSGAAGFASGRRHAARVMALYRIVAAQGTISRE